MPYADVVELALYHPEHGFYFGVGQAGRRGDFITSPEVGPLFGHVVANAIDTDWIRLGRPDLFTVVDYGAGPGTLARSILDADPQCREALRYIAVERSEHQRAQHPDTVLSVDELLPEVIGEGLTGVVVANELLDNLAFGRIERVGGVLQTLDVAISSDGSLELVPSNMGHDFEALFDASVGSAVFQPGAASWLAAARSALALGRVIVIDYARLNSAEVEIRTYSEHARAGNPLDQLGTKDITVDVDLEQLQRAVGPADRVSTQSEWLRGHGISELVEEGKRMWEENAAVGDLAALKFRSRVREADSLLAEDGLGGFYVAEWEV